MKWNKANKKVIDEAYISLHEKLASLGKSYGISESQAEDLLNEGYLRLSDKPISSENEAKAKFWITIKNLYVDNFRKQKKLVPLNNNELLYKFYNDRHNIDYELIKSQMELYLSPIQLKIMTLLVDQDMDYPEIAETLSMSEGAVRTNVCRARKILKENLEL